MEAFEGGREMSLCPECGEALDLRPDNYYECPGCGGVYSLQRLQELEKIRT